MLSSKAARTRHCLWKSTDLSCLSSHRFTPRSLRLAWRRLAGRAAFLCFPFACLSFGVSEWKRKDVVVQRRRWGSALWDRLYSVCLKKNK